MSAPVLRVLAAAGVLIAFMIGVAVYEGVALGLHFAREVEPSFDAWSIAKLALTAVLSLVLVAAIAGTGSWPEGIGKRALALAWVTMLVSVGSLALLRANPQQFATVGAEDSAIEWLSAALLFAASAFMAQRTLRSWRESATTRFRKLHLMIAVGFAFLFFLMGMEEVSWFQRQIGFETPAGVAERNWQGEFNLHNFQTDIAELLLYSSTGLFLVLLPLVRESALARLPVLAPFASFLPDRTVAAISAPMVVFTYSHWTLLPVQATSWITLGVCLAFAASSSTTKGRAFWAALALWVTGGQAAILVTGDTMLMMYDSSEYRELFIAIGLAAYAFRQWTVPGRLTDA
ncbi:hypothetical protein [Qipengyuania flava]|uniref:hypothetical protein n=1 Tax=Qipengyuania flava TaxID=192812 RepID=UPI001C63713B|nr:hypothetical protein [Qipengyuania flava]QYJ08176.1 hypothetical protein KUV82_05605 [Qipengyuania flava]